MIFAPIVQIANECHCFICTRSKLSDHNTCAICKLIFDFSNCTIFDCVTNRWDLTRFYNKCRHTTIRCKCAKCLHSALLPQNYMNINTLHSVGYLQTHLALACTRTKTKVYNGQRASECSVRPSEIPLARYWFYALPQQILRFTMQVGQLCKIGVGRV